MGKKKILMFDFDGVLADSFEVTYYCNKKVHNPKLTRSVMRQAYEGNFYKTAGKWVRPDKAKDFFLLYSTQFNNMPPYRNIGKALKNLQKNYILTIVTSTGKNVVKNYFKKYRLSKYFKNILGMELNESKIAKINFLISKYRTIPEQCLFITDTLGDILEARKCGVKSIAVTGGFHFESTLRKGKPLKIVKNPKDLVRAIDQYFK